MNARRLILAALASLSALGLGLALTAPAALAEETCPNAAARQGPSAALPNCRAYEQVTPVNKGDAQDLFPSSGEGGEGAVSEDPGIAAENGNSFLLLAPTALPGGSAFTSAYVFSRGLNGWTTTAINPDPGVNRIGVTTFDPVDLSELGVEEARFSHLPGQPEEQIAANSIGAPGGPYTAISAVPYAAGQQASIAGASEDLSHVVLEGKNYDLAPGASGQDAGSKALYEWERVGDGSCTAASATFSGSAGGCIDLVNVNSSGSLLSPCGAVLGLLGRGESLSGGTRGAVSSDGSKIFFTAPDPYASGSGCWESGTTPETNPPELYMRLNGGSTVEISAPEPGVSDPTLHMAAYVGAAANGSKVFFMTETEVTKNDTGHAPELYEYNTEAPVGERLVRVSSGDSGTAEGDVDFVGAISSDGSAVYFAAYGALAPGASQINAVSGGLVNLYRYDTGTKQTTFIAKVKGSGYPLHTKYDPSADWYNAGFSNSGTAAHERALDASANWYTTANGQYLVFGSSLPLTGYDSAEAPDGTCESESLYAEGSQEGRCVELFRYDAAAEERGEAPIVCVSCGPAGVQQLGNAEFARSAFVPTHGVSSEDGSVGPPRPISEDGAYVFFDSLDALVPQTAGGKLHVYEWHDGQVSLISSADDLGDAFFLDSSADGSNVFFGTHAQLVPQDTDTDGDLYDARIDGGFTEVAPSLCSGSGCQGAPLAPPLFATPASVTFEGVGNFPAGSGAAAKATVKTKTKPKSLSEAQKLARALKACRSKPKSKRKSCAAAARKRYRAKSKSKAKQSNRRGN